MVQRKVPNKLGIQADHVKSEKQLGNLMKPINFNQDGRNRGATDLKKKMKKSRSKKLSDIESLRSSSPLKQNISQPEQLPPALGHVPAIAATPPKQSTIKASDRSPNYMKSTTSFDARKEQTQVSPRTTQTGFDTKNPSRKNLRRSKLDDSSGSKPTRTLSRSSSWKLVRTLTKTPSFKPARSSATKCSKVALCADINAHRATCSSTLKDSKFPAYLVLNPGGTELEGTSAMKVCPYTYCSLNGHHHAPLPPLKCFLSARRRLLKTQKSLKLEALSPRKTNTPDDGTKEIITDVAVSAFQEEDLCSSSISPLIREGSMDFFIEIYAKNKIDVIKATGSRIDDGVDQKKIDFTRKMADDIMSSTESVEQRIEEDGKEHDAESISDDFPGSETDYEDNLDQNIDVISTAVDIIESCEGQKEDAEGEFPTFLTQEEMTQQYIESGSDGDGECSASIEVDKFNSETSDMEWEEEQLTASPLDHEADYTTQMDDDVGRLSEVKNPDLLDESISKSKSDNAISNCFEEIAADEELKEVCREESASFEAEFGADDSEPDEMRNNLDDGESSQTSESNNHDQLSFLQDVFEKSTAAEEMESITEIDDRMGSVDASASMEEPTKEVTADNKDDETNYSTDLGDKAFSTDPLENDFQPEDDTYAMLENQFTDFSADFNSRAKDEGNDDQVKEHKSIKECQTDAFNEKNAASQVVIDDSLLKREDAEAIQSAAKFDSSLDHEVLDTDIVDATENNDQLETHISDPSQPRGCLEAEQEDSKTDDTESHKVNEECQCDAIAEDSVLRQHFVDGNLLSVTQDQASDRPQQPFNSVESQNRPEEDHSSAEKSKSSSVVHSEEQRDSDMNKCTSADYSVQNVEEMEAEELDAPKGSPNVNSIASSDRRNASFNMGIDADQEQPDICKNPKDRCKRPVTDSKESRNFNPRDPNFLPVEPDPEAEKVDLKHQMMDERKNTEEWMLDYALRQAVTKLAPARKRKVALLVEAFETVLPIPKYEPRLRQTTAAFAHVRTLQACS